MTTTSQQARKDRIAFRKWLEREKGLQRTEAVRIAAKFTGPMQRSAAAWPPNNTDIISWAQGATSREEIRRRYKLAGMWKAFQLGPMIIEEEPCRT